MLMAIHPELVHLERGEPGFTGDLEAAIGTFFEAFPNGVIWGNTNNGQGYDLVLLGQVGDQPIRINVDAVQEKLNGSPVDWMEHVSDEQYRR